MSDNTITGALTTWWEARTEEQRATLKESASNDNLDQTARRLLIDTNCPIGPVGTKWETEPDFGWTWPGSVRDFILAQ
ncbi:hypothetical protein HGK72_08100 [Mycolicibacterium fortuitum]|uniref:hypothetical protein n=1 Tax=Mycolicibacterium fortuitum TaxID=1766 RepID=UPI00149010AE|nr:hypothetical protein [Mycolicibacterium fortuitum]